MVKYFYTFLAFLVTQFFALPFATAQQYKFDIAGAPSTIAPMLKGFTNTTNAEFYTDGTSLYKKANGAVQTVYSGNAIEPLRANGSRLLFRSQAGMFCVDENAQVATIVATPIAAFDTENLYTEGNNFHFAYLQNGVVTVVQTDGTAAGTSAVATANVVANFRLVQDGQRMMLCYTTSNETVLAEVLGASLNLIKTYNHTTLFDAKMMIRNNEVYRVLNTNIVQLDNSAQGYTIIPTPNAEYIIDHQVYQNKIFVILSQIARFGANEWYTPYILMDYDGTNLNQKNLEYGVWHTSGQIVQTYFFKQANNNLYFFRSTKTGAWTRAREIRVTTPQTNDVLITQDYGSSISACEVLDNQIFYTTNTICATINDLKCPKMGAYHLNTATNQCSQILYGNAPTLTQQANGLFANNATDWFRNDMSDVVRNRQLVLCMDGSPSPITNLRPDTTGGTTRLTWNAPATSATNRFSVFASNNFEYAYLDEVFYQAGQTQYSFAVDMSNVPSGYSKDFYVYAHSSNPICDDGGVALSYCNSARPSAQLFAAYDSTQHKTLLRWQINTDGTYNPTISVYKNGQRIVGSLHYDSSYLDEFATGMQDQYELHTDTFRCVMPWVQTFQLQQSNCAAQMPSLTLTTDRTAISGGTRFDLAWSVQNEVPFGGAYDVYNNENYITRTAANTHTEYLFANGDYQFTIKSNTNLLCPNYILAQSQVFNINNIAINTFEATMSTQRNEAAITWSVNMTDNLDHFELWEINSQATLPTPPIAIIPVVNGQLNYTYPRRFFIDNMMFSYKLQAVKSDGSIIQAANEPSIVTTCYPDEVVQMQDFLQTRTDSIHVKISFDLPATSLPDQMLPDAPILHFAMQHLPIINQNSTLHYEIDCHCPDTLLYNAAIELRYNSNVAYCWNNTIPFALDCRAGARRASPASPVLGSNPASNNFSVILPSSKKQANVTITNANGTLIDTLSQSTQTKLYDCANFQKGFYIITVDDGETKTQLKLLKL